MVQFWSKIYMNLQSEEKSGMVQIPLDNLGDSNSVIQDTTSNLSSLALGIFKEQVTKETSAGSEEERGRLWSRHVMGWGPHILLLV